MKTRIQTIMVVAVAFLAQGLFNPTMANSDDKKPNSEDSRIQVKNNQVHFWYFNEDRSTVTVKVYNTKHRIVKQVNLGNEQTLGKILDFSSSDAEFYRIVITADDTVLYNDMLKLGKV